MEPNHTLASWENLNAVVRLADEAACRRLLALEAEGKRRTQYLLRIHSRLNRLRAARERQDLLGLAAGLQKKVPWL